MKKKALLVVLLVLPALFWVFFEKVKINSYRLNYYGPKKVIRPGDTIFYSVPDTVVKFPHKHSIVAFLVQDEFENKQYYVQSLLETLRFKPEKVKEIPMVFYYLKDKNYDFFNYLGTTATNLCLIPLDSLDFFSLKKSIYAHKPVHVFEYFGVLLDAKNHIRGYYNFTFTDEVKRMVQEYRHLRLKEEVNFIRKNHVIEQR
ncbi:MAG: hypothetical protein N3F09_03670 [Bacteroidia bacterium]|nr:hypothetical protein [Bacteroidia bacterium]